MNEALPGRRAGRVEGGTDSKHSHTVAVLIWHTDSFIMQSVIDLVQFDLEVRVI
jgi:hypothetical protein